MKRKLADIAVVVVLLACCPGCTKDEAAKKTAEKFFESFSVPGPSMTAAWGMTDFRVFGRDTRFDVVAAGGMSVEAFAAKPGSPEMHRVTIPMWCEGKNLAGHEVKLRRKLVLEVVYGKVRKYRFEDDRPLSGLRQFVTWFCWTLTLPVLCGLWVLWLFWGVAQANAFLAVLVGIGAGGFCLFTVGWIAWVCYGSGLAVFLSLLLFAILAGGIIKKATA